MAKHTAETQLPWIGKLFFSIISTANVNITVVGKSEPASHAIDQQVCRRPLSNKRLKQLRLRMGNVVADSNMASHMLYGNALRNRMRHWQPCKRLGVND